MNPDEQDTVSFRWTLGFAVVAAVAAAVFRILPHPMNLTMLGALGVWGGARLRSWQALLLPLLVWAGTDLFIWWQSKYPPFNPFVYASFLLYALLGLLIRNRVTLGWVGAVTVLGSVQFFLLTNFSVWLASATTTPEHPLPSGQAFVLERGTAADSHPYVRYAPNAEGLLACYVMGLPFTGHDRAGQPVPEPFGFFGNLLIGDAVFTAALFGLHALLLTIVRRRAPAWSHIS